VHPARWWLWDEAAALLCATAGAAAAATFDGLAVRATCPYPVVPRDTLPECHVTLYQSAT